STVTVAASLLCFWVSVTIDLVALATVDIHILGALALSLAIVTLGVVVFLHNPRVAVNQRFALMTLATAGWVFAISLAVAANDAPHTLAFARMGFAFASGIPFSMLWMVDSVSSSPRRALSIRVALPAICCAAFVVASFTPLLVVDASPAIDRPQLTYGPLHRLFGAYFILCFASGVYILWQTIDSASGAHRLRLRYLLLGIVL